MKKIIGFTLILTGVSLEVLYYFQRYVSDGTLPLWSLVQGIALTALLIGLFIQVRENRLLWILIVPLAIYSIANTSAGQRQSLVMKAQNDALTINTERIGEIDDSIERKQKRYDEVSALINNSISDFDEYWEWKNTTARYEGELKDLDSDIEELKREKSELLTPDIDVTTNMQIYVFWSDIFGLDNPDLIQLIMQIVFSFFIAIMAPVGTYMVMDGPGEKQKEPEPEKDPEIEQEEIKEELPEEPKKEIKKPEVQPETFQDYKPPEKGKQPIFNVLPFDEVKHIAIILTRHKDYPGRLLTAKEAHGLFVKFHQTKPIFQIRSEEECQMVSRWIYENGLMGKSEKEIIEKLEEEYNA